MPKLPAIVQDIPGKARAAEAAGADAIASINTLNSLPGIDIHTFVPYPSVDGRSAFQGLSGAAVKPVALRTVAQIAKAVNIPVSGIGGIYNWRDAVEFILAGASSLQVCSAVMHHGYRIINDMTAGLLNYMEEMGFETINDFCGKALPHTVSYTHLDVYKRQPPRTARRTRCLWWTPARPPCSSRPKAWACRAPRRPPKLRATRR